MSSHQRWIFGHIFLFAALSCVSAQAKLLLPICNSSRWWGYCDTDGVIVIPFSYREAHEFENGVAEVWDNDWSRHYVDERGKKAIRKEDLQSYVPPLLRSEKVDRIPRLIHRDGRVVEFPDFRYVIGYSDGCATGVTKDHRGAFSRDPLNVDAWKYLSNDASIVFYDERSKILTFQDRGTNAMLRYQSAVNGDVRHLEETVRKHAWSSVCINSRLQVIGDGLDNRWGVVSDMGKDILPCEYDRVETLSFYILAWKFGDERKHSEVSFFDDSGLRNLSLTVDGDRWITHVPSVGWYMFAIGGTNFWVGVGDKKKLHVEGDKVVVEQIKW